MNSQIIELSKTARNHYKLVTLNRSSTPEHLYQRLTVMIDQLENRCHSNERSTKDLIARLMDLRADRENVKEIIDGQGRPNGPDCASVDAVASGSAEGSFSITVGAADGTGRENDPVGNRGEIHRDPALQSGWAEHLGSITDPLELALERLRLAKLAREIICTLKPDQIVLPWPIVTEAREKVAEVMADNNRKERKKRTVSKLHNDKVVEQLIKMFDLPPIISGLSVQWQAGHLITVRCTSYPSVEKE